MLGITSRAALSQMQGIGHRVYNAIMRHAKPLDLYDAQREEMYGRNARSYDGESESGKLAVIAKDALEGGDQIKNVRIIVSEIPTFQMRQIKARDNTHAYLRVNAGGKDLIVDPAWRGLFFVKSGKVEKWSSYYAEYLYDLPPVFVGTDADMYKMIKRIRDTRIRDPYHSSDVTSDVWYKNTRIFKGDIKDGQLLFTDEFRPKYDFQEC